MGLDVIALIVLALWAGAEIDYWRRPPDSTESIEAGHTASADGSPPVATPRSDHRTGEA